MIGDWFASRQAHIAFMRANPLHKGHGIVVDLIKRRASKGDYKALYLSFSHDNKKNPLTPQQKIKYARASFADDIDIFCSPDLNNILKIAAFYNDSVQTFNAYTGSDRAHEMQELLDRYNGVEKEHGFYHYEHIDVFQAGEPRQVYMDPMIAGHRVSTYSSSCMRRYAEQYPADFYRMCPDTLSLVMKEDMRQAVIAGLKSGVLEKAA